IVAKSKNLYQAILKDVPFDEMHIPVWSNTTAAEYPKQAVQIKERLTDHLVQPVRFMEEIQAMYQDGARLFIEVGPGKVLSSLTKSCLDNEHMTLHVEDGGQSKLTHLLRMFAQYIGSGRSFHLEKLFDHRNVKLIHLDQPDQYKKSTTIWRVNGQSAKPVSGVLPLNGALPIITPLKMKNTPIQQDPPVDAQNNTERLLQEYLVSMKMLMQAQTDVMLSFLGQHPRASSPAAAITPPVSYNHPVEAVPVVTAAGEKFRAPESKQAPLKDIKMLLLEVVSEKTGYPKEMLGLEMDMEADLSIDSIKRIEIIGSIRDELGTVSSNNDDTVMEQLAAIKTLGGLHAWLSEHSVEAVTTDSTVIENTGAVALQSKKITSRKEIEKAILDVVSEKTGYPLEMLGMDLDLEADLSIDSIKRIEIIAALRAKIGLAADLENAEDLTEKLAAIKTLNGLAVWAHEFNDTVPVENALSRLRFDLIPQVVSLSGNPDILNGKRFAIASVGEFSPSPIQEALQEHDAVVQQVDSETDLSAFDGLIMVSIYSAGNNPNIADQVKLLKKLDTDRVKWVFLISDLSAHMDTQVEARFLRHYQGYSGFFKSLDREFEGTNYRLISLRSGQEEVKLADIITQELLATDKCAEVIYKNGKRHRVDIIQAPLAIGLAGEGLKLEKNSVVLALGGAQGITAELISHMSNAYPCTYILVGRSADPRKDGSRFVGAGQKETKEEIRKRLIRSGGFDSPSQIENETQRIFKSNQILHTIRQMEESGNTVIYHSLNLCEEERLSMLIDDIYKEYGRLDGVIHGAGLLEDKLFKHKSPESFKRVFDTKVNPLRVLAERLREDCQFVVLFSSIASVYGNKGQTDYAAANSVLDVYANVLDKRLHGKVVSINWGPWKGAGMVSPSLEAEYERRGISLIPLEEGKEVFLNELRYGTESQVLIMSGNNW
ncbi:MAG: SDR family NAD(P)-dependent oxidoreductase, partial [Sphingobacterium sp.]